MGKREAEDLRGEKGGGQNDDDNEGRGRGGKREGKGGNRSWECWWGLKKRVAERKQDMKGVHRKKRKRHGEIRM